MVGESWDVFTRRELVAKHIKRHYRITTPPPPTSMNSLKSSTLKHLK